MNGKGGREGGTHGSVGGGGGEGELLTRGVVPVEEICRSHQRRNERQQIKQSPKLPNRGPGGEEEEKRRRPHLWPSCRCRRRAPGRRGPGRAWGRPWREEEDGGGGSRGEEWEERNATWGAETVRGEG